MLGFSVLLHVGSVERKTLPIPRVGSSKQGPEHSLTKYRLTGEQTRLQVLPVIKFYTHTHNPGGGFIWTSVEVSPGLFNANRNGQSFPMASEFTGDSGRRGNGVLGSLCFSQVGQVQIRFLSVCSVA